MGVLPPHGYPAAAPAFNLYEVDPGASAWQWEPLTVKAGRAYRQGHLPLWNASQGFGAPLAANMHSAAFFVPALPLLLAPTPAMWDAYLLARLLFAGVATFAVLRLFHVGAPGAIGAAAAFMLSGAFLFWLNVSWLSIEVLIPFLVYAVERLIRRPAGWWVLGLGLACGAAFLGGMPESTFVVLGFTGAVAAFRLGGLLAAGTPWRDVGRRAAVLAAAAGLGAGTSAVLLLPFGEYLDHSWHQHTPATAVGLRYFPLRALITLIAPYVDGPPLQSAPVVVYYTGLVAVTLAVIGVFTRRERSDWTRFCLLAAAVLALAKAYGAGLNWIGSLPLFALVDFPKHLGVVICFAVAVLAGLGLDAVERGRVAVPVAIAGPLVAQAGAIALLGIHGSAIGARLGPGYFVRGLGVAAGLAAAIQVALLVPAITRRGVRVAALACVALLLGELVYLAPKPARPHRHPSDTAPPAVELVRQDRSAFRVFGVDGVLYPNASSYFDFADIRALDALYPARYLRYVHELVNPTVFDRFTGGRSSSVVVEQPSRCGSNPWFDLLGVKYVFAPRGWPLAECAGNPGFGWLAWNVLNTVSAPLTGPSTFVIDGVKRPVVFQHPPSEVRFDFRPEPRHRALSFSVALDPRVWAPDKGDGVQFEMAITAAGQRRRVFSRWVDPKNNPNDRHWIRASIDLAPYSGREIEVELSTQPGAANVWDWAGWGDLRVEGEADPAARYAGQYALAYDGELRVFRNATAMPRAFVVHRVEVAPGPDAALRRLKRLGFDPATTVVLEGFPAGAAATFRPGSGPALVPAAVAHDGDGQVTVRTAASAPGVLVLTDVFYPGWVATVDGAPAPIYPADYAFRGVVVPAGEHIVEFAYRPTSFAAGAAISGASLLVLVALAVVTRRRQTPALADA
jgi:hypothetical protein